MKEIKNPKEVVIPRFDGVTESAVYFGGLTSLKAANSALYWRRDAETSEMIGVPYQELTLAEIAEQLGGSGGLVTVITQQPLRGAIYQWGNYGDSWWLICETAGYA